MGVTRYGLVGFLFLAALVLLGWVTVKVRSLAEIVGPRPQRLEVLFTGSAGPAGGPTRGGVGGLRRGDPVTVAGVQVGRVEAVRLEEADPRRYVVRVVILVHEAVRLRAGYRIRITDASLLGGKQVEIDPGQGEPVPPGVYRGELLPSPVQSLSEILAANRSRIEAVLADLQVVTARLRRGEGTAGRLLREEDVYQSLTAALDKVNRAAQNALEGPGVLRALLFDRQLRADLERAMQAIRTGFEDLEAGRGTLGKLLQSPELHDRLVEAAEGVARTVARVERGEGTVGVLLQDPEAAAGVRRFARALGREDTLLGRLSRDGETGTRFRRAVAHAEAILGRIRSGGGTLGRLVYDDTLARGLERAVRALTGTLDEAREAAPVNAFLQALFAWW